MTVKKWSRLCNDMHSKIKVKVKVRRVLKSDYRDHEESIISSTANFTIHLIVFQSYTSVKSNPKRRSIWLGNQKSPSPRIQHVKSKNIGRSDWVTKNRPRLDLNPGLQHEKRLTYWLSQGARFEGHCWCLVHVGWYKFCMSPRHGSFMIWYKKTKISGVYTIEQSH